jgi:hypothetical protein
MHDSAAVSRDCAQERLDAVEWHLYLRACKKDLQCHEDSGTVQIACQLLLVVHIAESVICPKRAGLTVAVMVAVTVENAHRIWFLRVDLPQTIERHLNRTNALPDSPAGTELVQ